jgi:hypothetical protein
VSLIKSSIVLSLMVAFQGFSQTTQGSGSYLKQAAISESAGIVHLTANSPRPLLQILDALQQKYGWVVDYEDPQYVSQMDLVDAPGGSHSRLPGGGSFSVEFPAGAPQEEKILHLVVDSYNRSKNPGRFELRPAAPGVFYVVGIAAHDEKDAISSQPVLFDLPITVAAGEKPITATLDLICQEVTAQSHTAVTIGVSPRALLDHAPAKVGGTKVAARDLLLQGLMATHHTLYWRLLFDPNSKGYFLDIHTVRSS